MVTGKTPTLSPEGLARLRILLKKWPGWGGCPGTLKFEFTPSRATKGNYTYSGPFNAKGKGPYEIFASGKMLVSGIGCIMGGHCADYSHDWVAKPIDLQSCGKGK